MSVPPATEMFQFAGFASRTYGLSTGYPLPGGLPHSETPGSPIARISPGLVAACHVLHRLSVPRHPPDALTSRLIAGVFSRRENTASPPAHRAKTPPGISRAESPRKRGPKLRRAASHEDTSSDRAEPCGPSLSTSVTSRLSLFTLQSASALRPSRRSVRFLR